MEDHLSAVLTVARDLPNKSERITPVIPMRRAYVWPRWGTWAAAAALVLAALYLGRSGIDNLFAPGGPRATVAFCRGSLYFVSSGNLKSGSAIGEGEVVRTGPDSRAVLRLADGSLIDVNERTELSLHAAWTGQSIRLQRGDIIVQAPNSPAGICACRPETRSHP